MLSQLKRDDLTDRILELHKLVSPLGKVCVLSFLFYFMQVFGWFGHFLIRFSKTSLRWSKLQKWHRNRLGKPHVAHIAHQYRDKLMSQSQTAASTYHALELLHVYATFSNGCMYVLVWTYHTSRVCQVCYHASIALPPHSYHAWWLLPWCEYFAALPECCMCLTSLCTVLFL